MEKSLLEADPLDEPLLLELLPLPLLGLLDPLPSSSSLCSAEPPSGTTERRRCLSRL
jgi:hypothetical protein